MGGRLRKIGPYVASERVAKPHIVDMRGALPLVVSTGQASSFSSCQRSIVSHWRRQTWQSRTKRSGHALENPAAASPERLL
jgi:hypothetical protein